MGRQVEISVEKAAKVMHKDPQCVRWGLEQGTLPFGSVMQNPNGKRKSFHIVPVKFYDYMGMTKEEVMRELKEIEEGANQ